tara:strand:+ start:225 stop:551 length:327 start_codon:yes stop_codon:yes gene_type:complete
VNSISQIEGLKALKNNKKFLSQIDLLKSERTLLTKALSAIPSVTNVYPSEANFLLIEFDQSDKIFSTLKSKGIIVRDRTKEVKNCLRITVGTPEQNRILINAIKEIKK